MSINEQINLDLRFEYKISPSSNEDRHSDPTSTHLQIQDAVSNIDSDHNANEIYRPTNHTDFQLTDLLNTKINFNNSIPCEYNDREKTEGKGVSTVDPSTEYRLHLDEDQQEIQANRYRRQKSDRSEVLNEKMLGEIEARDQAMKNVRILDTPANDPIICNSNFF